MIKNDLQLKSSEKSLAYLKEMLAAPVKEEIPESVANAAKSHVLDSIKEIEAEIDKYKKLSMEKKFTESIKSLEDLLKIPILYRFAFEMTVDQFARKVEISARQIARYEKEEYQNISMTNFLKILEKLDLRVSGKILFDKKKECFETEFELHNEPHQKSAKETA